MHSRIYPSFLFLSNEKCTFSTNKIYVFILYFLNQWRFFFFHDYKGTYEKVALGEVLIYMDRTEFFNRISILFRTLPEISNKKNNTFLKMLSRIFENFHGTQSNEFQFFFSVSKCIKLAFSRLEKNTFFKVLNVNTWNIYFWFM